MKPVPTFETLKLLAEADQQLYVHQMARIGLKCERYHIDPTANAIDPILVESLNTAMTELDEYRATAISIAQERGYRIILNEDLIGEQLVINEIFSAVYNAAKSVLGTIGRWLYTAIELAVPLVSIALDNNRRFYRSEVEAQQNTNLAIAEFLYKICDEPKYSSYLQKLDQLLTTYITDKYSREGKGRLVANINISTLYGYNEYKQTIDRIVASGISDSIRGITDRRKKNDIKQLGIEVPDHWILTSVIANIKNNKINDYDGSLKAVLQPHLDRVSQKYAADVQAVLAGP
jgi:hypothetical protein